jgi:hypothetical protein
MARSRDQRSVKNDSAAPRASAHKLGSRVGTWSTTRHHNVKSQPLSGWDFFARSPGVCAVSSLCLLSMAPRKSPFQACFQPFFSLCSLLSY